MTGFGRKGPYANVKAYEALVMARVGALWASQGMVARAGPAHVSVPYCTYGASQQLLTGLFAALHERERSGEGQHVEATLVNGLASLGTWNWYLNVITSKFPDAFTPSAPFGAHGLPLSPMVFMLLIALSKDGRWLQFSQVQLHLYVEMLKVMGLDWMLQDEEWKDAVFAADTPKTGEFWDKLYEAVQSRTLAEWNEVFEADHDVWAETMRRGSELLDHPQMQHLGAVVELDDAERGSVRQPGPIVKMSATPAVLDRGAPALDADGAALRSAPWKALGGAEVVTGAGSVTGERALGDVTLLELGTFFAAPFGGTVLRELGARVIKVEPMGGEPMRGLLPFPEVGAAKCMQGKESICVDLSTPEGREIVHDLVRKLRHGVAVVQGRCGGAPRRRRRDAPGDQSGPRVPERTGLRDRRPLRRPTGLCADHRGRQRPRHAQHRDVHRRATRPDVARRSGPTPCGSSGAGTTEYAQADGISALTAASAMTLGLLVRDRTGTSQEMLTTMLTSTAHALADDMVEYTEPAGDPGGRSGAAGLLGPIPPL